VLSPLRRQQQQQQQQQQPSSPLNLFFPSLFGFFFGARQTDKKIKKE